NHYTTARRFNLLASRWAEAVRHDGEGLLEVPRANNFQAIEVALEQTSLAERCFAHFALVCEALEHRDVDGHHPLREWNAEASLRQTPLHGGLAALEVQLAKVTRLASLLTLEAASADLTNARARSAPDSPLLGTRALWRRQLRQHAH